MSENPLRAAVRTDEPGERSLQAQLIHALRERSSRRLHQALQIAVRDALATRYSLHAEPGILKVSRNMLEGSTEARRNDGARSALPQRSTLSDRQCYEIVDVGHDRIS